MAEWKTALSAFSESMPSCASKDGLDTIFPHLLFCNATLLLPYQRWSIYALPRILLDPWLVISTECGGNDAASLTSVARLQALQMHPYTFGMFAFWIPLSDSSCHGVRIPSCFEGQHGVLGTQAQLSPAFKPSSLQPFILPIQTL